MKNWISKSVFVMFYYSGMFWASFRHPLTFLCVFICCGEAVEFIISCSTSTVLVSQSFSNFPPTQNHLFVLLAPVHQKVLYPATVLHSLCFIIAHYCVYNTRFVTSGEAHLS